MLGRSADLLSAQNIYTVTRRAMTLLVSEVTLVVASRDESTWWLALATGQHLVTFANQILFFGWWGWSLEQWLDTKTLKSSKSHLKVIEKLSKCSRNVLEKFQDIRSEALKRKACHGNATKNVEEDAEKNIYQSRIPITISIIIKISIDISITISIKDERYKSEMSMKVIRTSFRVTCNY